MIKYIYRDFIRSLQLANSDIYYRPLCRLLFQSLPPNCTFYESHTATLIHRSSAYNFIETPVFNTVPVVVSFVLLSVSSYSPPSLISDCYSSVLAHPLVRESLVEVAHYPLSRHQTYFAFVS